MTATGKIIASISIVCFAVSSLGALAGCGDEGGDSATASAPLTKPQLVKQWEAICQKEDLVKDRRLEKASKEGGNYAAGSAQESTKLVTDVILPYYVELIEEMAALRPPAKDQAQIAKILAEYRRVLKESEADPRELIYNDTFQQANEVAIKYGIKNCTL